VPYVPEKVLNVFLFLTENQNLVTTVVTPIEGPDGNLGLTTKVTGLDRSALITVAPLYGLELDRWLFPLRLFERGLLRFHNGT
jgi:hypothetical protein